MTESLDAHVKGSGAFLHDLSIEKQQEIDKNKTISLENRKLKGELRKKFISKELLKWQLPGICLTPILLIVIVFYVLIFCFHNWQYNYSQKLMLWIDSLPKESMEHELIKEWVVNILSLGSIGILGNVIWGRLISISKRLKKIESIENNIPSKYL